MIVNYKNREKFISFLNLFLSTCIIYFSQKKKRNILTHVFYLNYLSFTLVPGEILVDSQTGNKGRDLDYAILDSETDIILPRDGLNEDDEIILVVDSSSEMPSQTHLDYGNRPSVQDSGTDNTDLESKSSVNRESPPIRNIVLTKVQSGSGNKFNESLECDEDNDDCSINKFSLEG